MIRYAPGLCQDPFPRGGASLDHRTILLRMYAVINIAYGKEKYRDNLPSSLPHPADKFDHKLIDWLKLSFYD